MRQQRDIFWPVGPLYGVLRRLKVHVVQHDILHSLAWGGVLYAMLYNLKFATSLAYLFRKPYLEWSNSSKTAYSCNAEFVVNFCTLLPEKLCEGPTLLANRA